MKVFLTMLAKKDSDHVVRASAFMIGEWAKKSEADTLKALKVLSNPDKRRLEPQPYEGRRVQKVEDGWLVLNGQFYQDLMRSINRKAYKAAKQTEYRKRKAIVDEGTKAGAAQAIKECAEEWRADGEKA